MIFYAPNVHVGGGFELLKSLIMSFDVNDDVYFILDSRAISKIDVTGLKNLYAVKPDPISRFKAELFVGKLQKKHSKIFCFHGLPPLFYRGDSIVVFLQNRLYISGFSVFGYSLKTALRLTFERFVFYTFRFKVTEFIVQSNSMKAQIEKKINFSKPHLITVQPFIDQELSFVEKSNNDKKYDFCFIADGSAHKNHNILFEAWRLLAIKGYFPSLVVTLSEDYVSYIKVIEKLNKEYSCNIINIGYVSKDHVRSIYQDSKSLIYPSLTESFGMPLIEAKQLGLDVIAAELDYVRDVIIPDETFNPYSSVSVSLSVLRYIGEPSPLVKFKSPHEFISDLI